MAYDYEQAVREDFENFVREQVEYYGRLRDTYASADDAAQDLQDKAFVADSVTGNASGSYTFSTWIAEENVAHNWDFLAEAIADFGGYGATEFLDKGAEWADVAIRCHMLFNVCGEVVDEIWNEEEEQEG